MQNTKKFEDRNMNEDTESESNESNQTVRINSTPKNDYLTGENKKNILNDSVRKIYECSFDSESESIYTDF